MAPLDIQLYNFSVMVLAGMLIGLIYDSYRVLRMFVRPGASLTALGDLLLLIGVALTVGLALLVGNWGDLRLYVFIGIALGLGLYYELASDTFLKVALWTLQKLIGLFVLAGDIIYRAVAVPVAFLVGVLLVPLTFIYRLAGAGWTRTRVALGKVQGLAGPARSGLQQRASGLKEKLFGWLIGHKEG